MGEPQWPGRGIVFVALPRASATTAFREIHGTPTNGAHSPRIPAAYNGVENEIIRNAARRMEVLNFIRSFAAARRTCATGEMKFTVGRLS